MKELLRVISKKRDGSEGFIYALKLARCRHSLAASLAVLPSMSLIPSSSIVLIRGNHEAFNRLTLNKSIHNLRDVRDRDASVKKVIGFD
jgi:hypothetical protein